MSRTIVRLDGPGACRVEQDGSGATLRVETPPEFGGRGGGFSATDLVAAALGACVATSLAPIAGRNDLPLESLRVIVDKELARDPKRLARLEVRIEAPAGLDAALRLKLERAAHACPVHRSLSSDVQVAIRLVTRPGA